MADFNKILGEDYAKVEKAIEACNAAIADNDLEKLTTTTEALKEAEKEYAKNKKAEVYRALQETENPVKSALELFSYETVGHTEVRHKDTKILESYEIKPKTALVDLLDFCSKMKADTTWRYDVERFNRLMALRVAEDSNMTEAQKEDIRKYFKVSQPAYAQKCGKTPTSNSQCEKRAQEIFDQILFIDDGNGHNVFRVLKHNLIRLRDDYTTEIRTSRNSVRVSDPRKFMRIFTKMLSCIVTDTRYEIDFKRITDEDIVKYTASTEKVPDKKTADEVAA